MCPPEEEENNAQQPPVKPKVQSVPYQDRVRLELEELTGRVNKLRDFMFKKEFEELSGPEQVDLGEQVSAMMAYQSALYRRVARF